MPKVSRRDVLKLAGLAAILALRKPNQAAAGLLDRLLGKASAGKLASAITPNQEFYVTSIGSTPTVKTGRWSLRIKGLVKNPITLSYNDLLKRPQTSVVSTLECIGNPIGGDSIGTARWEGVKLNAILDEAGADVDRAVDLVLRGADGYSDSFPAKRAMREAVLLVTKMNGVPLPPVHGFPARVIVPGIYGMKNVKWLTELELVDQDYRGYWEQRGWSDEAIVRVQSKIDLPGDGETIKAKDYLIQGIAFGGLDGIAKVEISTDGGQTFQDAELEPPLSPYSWVFWKYAWTPSAKGRYALIVRATDMRGVRQEPGPHGSYPDGAAGLHQITVTAGA